MGLSDDKNEFDKLVNEMWSSLNTKVIEGKFLSNVLNAMNVQPDFTYTKPQADTKLLYVHRKTNDRDIYWVDNRNDRVEDLEATFRVEGKIPELLLLTPLFFSCSHIYIQVAQFSKLLLQLIRRLKNLTLLLLSTFLSLL